MVNVNNNIQDTNLNIDDIPDNHLSCFIKEIAENNFGYLDDKYNTNITENNKKRGRPALSRPALLSIVTYAYYENNTTGSKMEQLCQSNPIYKFLGDGIEPNERTFQRFVKENKDVINEIFKKTVEFAKKSGYIHFNNKPINEVVEE